MNLGLLKEIPEGTFANLEQIDSGSFSDIFTAIHVKTQTRVALKITLKKDDVDFLQKEAKIHKLLHHPFICKYFTSIETEHLFIIVMELIEGTNLLKLVNRYRGLPVKEVQSILSQLVIVVEYLQEMNVSHRDLKLENILLDCYGHIRLIDFGFSSLSKMMSTCCGSIPYCAPEILAGNKYDKSTDIWSLGIILYALLNGFLPFFHHNIKTLALIICTNEIYFPPTIDIVARDLIEKMLIKDPSKRITIDEIKKHPFICQDKLFQIDYKALFSSKPKDNGSTTKWMLSSQRKRSYNSINLTNNAFNLMMRQNHRNIYRRRSKHHSTNEITKITVEPDLHDKITVLSDNVDDSILGRNDFALNLNKLIEMSYLKQ